MDKRERKSNLCHLALVATMAHKAKLEDGIIDVGTYQDRRMFNTGHGPLEHMPGVFMQPKAFLEYFGEDTNFEYVTDCRYGDLNMITEVNGVMFYTLIDNMDLIKDGRLV